MSDLSPKMMHVAIEKIKNNPKCSLFTIDFLSTPLVVFFFHYSYMYFISVVAHIVTEVVKHASLLLELYCFSFFFLFFFN